MNATAYQSFLGESQAFDPRPPSCRIPATSPLCTLIAQAHKAVVEALGSSDPATHPFRRNGAELVRLLTSAVTQRTAWLFAPDASVDLAMSCYLSEAIMHIGWCPDEDASSAKRAAHLYFALMKKSLSAAGAAVTATSRAYISDAWAMAQKTEGITERRLDAEEGDVQEKLTFETCDGLVEYQLVYQHRPVSFMLLPLTKVELPHPFSRLTAEGCGLRVIGHGNEATFELLDAGDIVRQGMWGHRRAYRCRISPDNSIRWTVVILTRGSTVYRIDVMETENARPVEIGVLELRLENSCPLKRAANGYTGRGAEDIVIEMVADPFAMSQHAQEEYVSVFRSTSAVTIPTEQVQMIVAWARGQGVTTINRTVLTGIY